MNTRNHILIAFLLNLFFSIFEFFGGIFTGSIAITSDALHDLGDAISIGASYLLERKSQRPADQRYTYGYGRYSVLGAALTTLILMAGSVIIISEAILRMINPSPIHHNGMILMAIVGIAVNTCAALFTRHGHSVNEKAVNLHMLEDILGWIVVLVGSFLIRLTGWTVLDPIMSIGLSLFILYQAIRNIGEILNIILQKVPKNMDPNTIMTALSQIPHVQDVHHLHIWTLDGYRNVASMHVVTDHDPQQIKAAVRKILTPFEIHHITVEIERTDEECQNTGYYHTAHHPHPHSHHHHHHAK